MGVSGDDMASHRRNSGKGKELIGFRRSVTMRIGLKYLTSALAAGAAAVAIAAAPATKRGVVRRRSCGKHTAPAKPSHTATAVSWTTPTSAKGTAGAMYGSVGGFRAERA